MAKMIPPYCDQNDPKLAAERRVFAKLKNDPATDGWTVLHSLELTSRGLGKPYGEIDFVILAPRGGVFCLEVKGGRVGRKEGVFYTKNRNGIENKLKRSPHQQAKEGMFALRNKILEKFGNTEDMGRLLFGFAAILPDVAWDIDLPEYEPWQTIDKNGFEMTFGKALKQLVVEHRRCHVVKNYGASEPAEKTIRQLIHFLRRDFDLMVSQGTRLRQAEGEIKNLTEEQFDKLDLVEDNDRCVFHGSAGTGKTVLACELACRFAKHGKSDKNRTLLLCYNRLLGKSFAETAIENQTVGTLHSCLKKIIEGSSFAKELNEAESEQPEDLYTRIYPELGRRALVETETKVDMLIVDEAQDLINANYLDVLDEWLVGGLKDGRWCFFGDFERQAIFGNMDEENMLKLLEVYEVNYTTGRLTINCRNTQKIGEETALMSGFDSLPYRLGRVEGMAVTYAVYESPKQQGELLAEKVGQMLNADVEAKDIVILSKHRKEKSAVAHLPQAASFSVHPVMIGTESTSVSFSTIQAFKGLESLAIVLCDVDDLESEEQKKLLYVAMSRAKARLIVLRHKQTDNAYKEAIRRNLTLAK